MTENDTTGISGLEVIVAANPGPLTLDGTRTYLVGERQLVIVDPGPALAEHIEAIEWNVAERPVRTICLTHAHADHAGAAREVASRLGARLAGSREALGRLGLEGRALNDGDLVDIDSDGSRLEALYTPGHSGDHLSFLWHPGRALFTGDLVLGEGSSMIAHPDGSVEDYLASLERLVAIRPVLLLPGHGEPVREAVEKLEEYRDHRLDRHRQIVEAVTARGARTISEICRTVYGDLPDERLRRAAELSVRAHLEYVRQTGGG